MNRIGKRIASRKGFTLLETFMALLILLMVTSVVAAGIPAAVRAYDKVVDAANAQVYLSTAMTRLKSELSTATNVTVDGTTVTYQTAGGYTNMLILVAPGGASEPGLYIREYADLSGAADRDRLLVSQKASGKDMYITYGTVGYANGVVSFPHLKVVNGTYEHEVADAYKIRVLSYQKEDDGDGA